MVPQRSLRTEWTGYVVSAAAASNLLGLALPIVLMQVYDRILPDRNLSTLVALMIGLGGAITLEFLLRLSHGWIITRGRALQEVELARRLHHRLLREDLDDVGQVSFAGHMDRMSALAEVNTTRQNDGTSIAVDAAFAALFVAVILLIAPAIAAVVALTLIAALAALRRIGRTRQDLSERNDEIESRRTAYLIQLFSSVATIKSLGAMAFMERRYERLMAGHAGLSAALTANAALVQGLGATLAFAMPIFAAAAGAALVIRGDLTVGGLAASILLSSRAVQQVMKLGEQFEGRAATRRLVSDVVGPAAPRPVPTQRITTVESLRARNLTLARGDGEQTVFADLDLDLHRGEAVALHGPVGSGKTALVNMLAGHLRPDAGEVRLNGTDIRAVEEQSLRRAIAYLPQRHSLLEGTLLENMTRFRPDLYRDEALALAEQLGLAGFLDAHHTGLATQVRRGVSLGLPAAIVDRVALIAGLVGNPSVILFDEANMALDAEGDRRLLGLLEARKPHAALLLISHRPSYAAICDRELRLEDGRLRPHVRPAAGRPAAPSPLILASASRC